jgi:hypothetical protein
MIATTKKELNKNSNVPTTGWTNMTPRGQVPALPRIRPNKIQINQRGPGASLRTCWSIKAFGTRP